MILKLNLECHFILVSLCRHNALSWWAFLPQTTFSTSTTTCSPVYASLFSFSSSDSSSIDFVPTSSRIPWSSHWTTRATTGRVTSTCSYCSCFNHCLFGCIISFVFDHRLDWGITSSSSPRPLCLYSHQTIWGRITCLLAILLRKVILIRETCCLGHEEA